MATLELGLLQLGIAHALVFLWSQHPRLALPHFYTLPDFYGVAQKQQYTTHAIRFLVVMPMYHPKLPSATAPRMQLGWTYSEGSGPRQGAVLQTRHPTPAHWAWRKSAGVCGLASVSCLATLFTPILQASVVSLA